MLPEHADPDLILFIEVRPEETPSASLRDGVQPSIDLTEWRPSSTADTNITVASDAKGCDTKSFGMGSGLGKEEAATESIQEEGYGTEDPIPPAILKNRGTCEMC